jgi:hypothetical protein
VAGGVRQSDQDAVAQPVQQLVADLARDGGQALFAGEVRVVDQLAQRCGDLDRPRQVGVDLRGVVKISSRSRNRYALSRHRDPVPARRAEGKTKSRADA